jgi:hypothetical protein
MTIRFVNFTLNSLVNEAIVSATSLLKKGSRLLLELEDKNDFLYDSGSGWAIVGKIANCQKVAEVRLYKTWNPWSKVMGYTNGVNIYINSRKLSSMSQADLVGLLCHEYLHIVGFRHGNNYKTKEKCEKSVPYFVSENISRWL